MTIIRNRAKCSYCGDIIESTYQHQMVHCSCIDKEEGKHGIFVDGGKSYLRRGWYNESEFIELSQTEEEE